MKGIFGIIRKALSGFYDVDCGQETVTCRARGKFRLEKKKPLVGDRVEIKRLPDGSGRIEEILPRKNQFDRPAVANLDQLVIVASGSIPVTDPFLIDWITVMASRNHCASVICINKWDLEQPYDLYETYQKAGFPTFCVSAKTGLGLAELTAQLAGKVCVLTGNSGVGKSSLINALDKDFQIPVGEVSEKLGRGRHTTRHVELFRLENDILLADTPGFSSLETWIGQYPPEELADAFPEFAPCRGKCRFTGCVHIREKGCAVLAALAEGKISFSRHSSYVRLYEQAKEASTTWKKKPSL